MDSSNIISTVIISIVSMVVLFLLTILIAMRKSNKVKKTKRNKTVVSKNLKPTEEVAPAKNYYSLIAMVKSHLNRNSFDKAELSAKEAVKIRPDLVSYLLLMEVYKLKGDQDSCKTIYKEAIKKITNSKDCTLLKQNLDFQTILFNNCCTRHVSYRECVDHVEYIDLYTKQCLLPDFRNNFLPDRNDILSFEGGKAYRMVNIKTRTIIHEINEHGGSDVEENALVTIERIGDIVDFYDFTVSLNRDNGSCTIIGYTGADMTVKIPDMIGGMPVVAINSDAFRNNSSITEIEIPIYVKKIGEYSFANCTRLKKAVLQVGDKEIYYSLWRGLEDLPHSLFEGCVSLESIYLPETVTSMGEDVFKGCVNLQKIQMGKILYERCKDLLPEGIKIQLTI